MISANTFWDRIAKKYSKQPIYDLPAYEKTMERVRARLTPQSLVLELGCGTGSTALLLSPHAEHTTATDVSAAMIDIANAKKRDAKIDNVDFVQTDVYGAALAGKSFDVVMAFNLLHLVPNAPEAFSRIFELVNPGGLFISKTPCLGGMNIFMKLMVRGMQMVGQAPDVFYFSADELEEMISAAGFDIEETGDYPVKPRPSRFVVARKA